MEVGLQPGQARAGANLDSHHVAMLWTVCRGVGGAEGDKQGDVQYTAYINVSFLGGAIQFITLSEPIIEVLFL